MELTYTKVGDYYIPDLVLDEPEPVRTIGKYGSLRRSYLKQHRRSFYQELVTSGKLQDHLIDIEDFPYRSDAGISRFGLILKFRERTLTGIMKPDLWD